MKFSLLTGASARWKLFTSVAAVVFVLDQWTKYLAVGHLTLAFHSAEGESLGFFQRLGRFLSHEHPVPHNTQTVLENFWHFRYVENPGAAWGLLGSAAEWFRTPFFLLVSMIAMVFIVQYFRRSEPHQSILRMALALVFGGAVGNFADRVRLGYVIDFID